MPRKGDAVQGGSGSGAPQGGLLPYISPEGKIAVINHVRPPPKGKLYKAVFLDE